ncbi:MAG: FliI/YscN family ATPase [Pseudomonadota bacterium]
MSSSVQTLGRIQRLVSTQSDRVFRVTAYGRVVRVVGTLLEATGIHARIGVICELLSDEGVIACEIIGFERSRCFLMLLAPATHIRPGTPIRLCDNDRNYRPSLDGLLGRVVDGLANPFDDGGQIPKVYTPPQPDRRINPMCRIPIAEPLDIGVRAINGLLSVGRGQRLGLFAGSGVGKSVLLGMLARFVKADVIVVGLIGERGREVREFVEENLGSALARSVVVACPADDSAALRLRGADLAVQLAQRFSDAGKHVLLLLDSLTRVAQAQREIGLAMGEPPSARGYPPSAFAALPKLVERTGNGTSLESGSVTAFYTVLMEEDDLNDPIVDAARAILDGHILLDRSLADLGIYPAIDVGASVSRVMRKVTPPEQQADIARFRTLWQTYRAQQDLINIGAYEHGSDPLIDEAIQRYPDMCAYVAQASDSGVNIASSQHELSSLLTNARQTSVVAIDQAEPV